MIWVDKMLSVSDHLVCSQPLGHGPLDATVVRNLETQSLSERVKQTQRLNGATQWLGRPWMTIMLSLC